MRGYGGAPLPRPPAYPAACDNGGGGESGGRGVGRDGVPGDGGDGGQPGDRRARGVQLWRPEERDVGEVRGGLRLARVGRARHVVDGDRQRGRDPERRIGGGEPDDELALLHLGRVDVDEGRERHRVRQHVEGVVGAAHAEVEEAAPPERLAAGARVAGALRPVHLVGLDRHLRALDVECRGEPEAGRRVDHLLGRRVDHLQHNLDRLARRRARHRRLVAVDRGVVVDLEVVDQELELGLAHLLGDLRGGLRREAEPLILGEESLILRAEVLDQPLRAGELVGDARVGIARALAEADRALGQHTRCRGRGRHLFFCEASGEGVSAIFGRGGGRRAPHAVSAQFLEEVAVASGGRSGWRE